MYRRHWIDQTKIYYLKQFIKFGNFFSTNNLLNPMWLINLQGDTYDKLSAFVNVSRSAKQIRQVHFLLWSRSSWITRKQMKSGTWTLLLLVHFTWKIFWNTAYISMWPWCQQFTVRFVLEVFCLQVKNGKQYRKKLDRWKRATNCTFFYYKQWTKDF